MSLDGFAKKPLCPFCSAEWTDNMVKVLDVSASQGCETCGYGSSVDYTVHIDCHACGKLIYQKDGRESY